MMQKVDTGTVDVTRKVRSAVLHLRRSRWVEMRRHISETLHLGMPAAVGGFLDAYTYLSRGKGYSPTRRRATSCCWGFVL